MDINIDHELLFASLIYISPFRKILVFNLSRFFIDNFVWIMSSVDNGFSFSENVPPLKSLLSLLIIFLIVPNNKIIRCKYCYRTEHIDLVCPHKRRKKPLSVPLWVSNARCMKCKKKGLYILFSHQSIHVK